MSFGFEKVRTRVCQRPIRLTFRMRNKALIISVLFCFCFLHFTCLSHSRMHCGILSLPFSASHLRAIWKYCFREIDDVVFISVAVVANDGSMNGWKIDLHAVALPFVQNNIIIAIININVQSEVGWRALTISLNGERHTPYAIIKEKLFERQSMAAHASSQCSAIWQ